MQLNVGKRKQTRVHDISVSIKCLIGIYISSFDPTRLRYRSSARFHVQARSIVLPPSALRSERQPECRAGNRLTRKMRERLREIERERGGDGREGERERERERIRKSEFTRFSFG